MRIDALVPDFQLLDSWELTIDDPPQFERLFTLVTEDTLDTGGSISRGLIALRALLGRWFGWDRPVERPIPGCAETTIAARLSDDDRKRTCVTPGEITSTALGPIRHIYRFEDETLLEVSNSTIHALLHLSWLAGSRPRLRVYIKSRGLFSRIYLAMIAPFRHLFVYPSWIAHVTERWGR